MNLSVTFYLLDKINLKEALNFLELRYVVLTLSAVQNLSFSCL